ncbi:MAG: putative sulfate exporter family transporter [Azoarcus sp.]|nr:putative sulfate exporter family transporter [Azoarcus sp.]MDX9838068.1 putative sulfate exporter family transporter [Azoarcus sp.]
MSTATMSSIAANLRSTTARMPGLMTALVIALASTFIAEHYGGPQFLYALLVGMAFHYLAAEPRTRIGIDFAARGVLRFGVALLGARITVGQIAELGPGPIALVVAGVGATLLFGSVLARRLGRTTPEGLLGSGAVAICGASAALAIAAALPKNEQNQRMTLLTVVTVTALSTVAMIVYPLVAKMLELSPDMTAVFFGGTIHDVAQVVGAGFLISPQVAETATLVKLFRVALLVPVVLMISLSFRRQNKDNDEPVTLLPRFLVGFVILVLINSAGLLNTEVSDTLSSLSRWCLVVAISALGVKTSFAELRTVGWQPIALIVANTVFLALWVLGGIYLLEHVIK